MWCETRGQLDTILRLKEIRTIFYSLHGPSPYRPFGYAVFKSGLPRIFGYELNDAFVAGDQRVRRLILTLVQVSRSIPAWKKVDVSTITTPSGASKEIIKEFADSIHELFERLPLRSERQPWQNLHIATTMGPIGPAMLTATELIPKFLARFKHLSEKLSFEPLVEYISKFEGLAPHWHKLYPSKENKTLRRLGVVPDVDGKSRVIGILDYWSQSILKPIHKDLMATLEALGGRGPDLTFGQDIRPFGPETEPYYSIDLTAATDRFPVAITEIVMSEMYDKDYAAAWRELMVGEPFNFGDSAYVYAAGQPMGAFSSWAAFSLSHHFIVQFAALRLGKPKFKDYKLLGDDIVIRDRCVAEEYIRIMHSLGVEISPHKTLVSETSFEFAKRFFHNGEEVTGFPINGLANVLHSWSEVVSVFRESGRRGYTLPFHLSRTAIFELYRDLRDAGIQGFTRYSNSYMRRLERKMLVLFWLLDRGKDDSLLKRITDLFKWTGSCNMRSETRKQIVYEAMAQIKANQLLDNVRVQVKKINGFIFTLRNRFQQDLPEFAHLDPTELPLIQSLLVNAKDQQDQMEKFRDLAKELRFEQILFDELLIPEIDPETLDSSRKSIRLLSSDSNMAIRGMLLLSNLERERQIELSCNDPLPESEEQHPDPLTRHPGYKMLGPGSES